MNKIKNNGEKSQLAIATSSKGNEINHSLISFQPKDEK